METPKDDPKPDEQQAQPPQVEPEEGESYEDTWYQVLKRRAESEPADDATSED